MTAVLLAVSNGTDNTPIWIAIVAAVLPTAGAALLWYLTQRGNRRLSRVISGDPASATDNGILGLINELQTKVHETEAAVERCESDKADMSNKVSHLEARVISAERVRDQAETKAKVFEGFIADHLSHGLVVSNQPTTGEQNDGDKREGPGG